MWLRLRPCTLLSMAARCRHLTASLSAKDPETAFSILLKKSRSLNRARPELCPCLPKHRKTLNLIQTLFLINRHFLSARVFRIGGGSGGVDASQQEYETVQKPCGFIYQLQLLSTHGDQYYVGLNAIEIFNSNGDRIALTANGRITIFPPIPPFLSILSCNDSFSSRRRRVSQQRKRPARCTKRRAHGGQTRRSSEQHSRWGSHVARTNPPRYASSLDQATDPVHDTIR